jgi:hypothetical protein
MARTAKRGISTAAAMVACAVCLVVTAAMVLLPVRVLAHGQANRPPSFHVPVDRVSTDVASDAARVSDVAQADDFRQRSSARTGQLVDIGQAGWLDPGSLLGLHVPADALRDACTGFAAAATRDRIMVVAWSRPGQAGVVLEHGVAGPAHPSRRMAMPRMRVVHVAAIPAADAVRHRAVTSTRLVWPVDTLSHRLLVEPVVRSHMHRGESIALHADRLHDRAAQLTAAACASEPDSARGPSPSPEKWTLEVSDHLRFHFRGLFTYCVSD